MSLYYHEKLPTTNVQKYNDGYCQALRCACESQKSLICVLYRPPECPLSNFRLCLDVMKQYIAGLDDEYQLSLLGDFNLPIVRWSNNSILSGGTACSIESANLLLEFMSENLCTQHVFDPTRNSNILDLYISNAQDLVSHVSTTDTPLSDHRRVEIVLSYNPCSIISSEPPDFTVSAFRSLDFQKADYSKISELISSAEWAVLFESCNNDGCRFIIVNFIIVKNTCAGKRMGRHINIKHQNQTAFINLLNLCDQKFVSVIAIS